MDVVMPTKTKTKKKASKTAHADRHIVVPHTKLRRHKSNMRKRYLPADVAKLAGSIKKRGVLQPLIVVRRARKRGHYDVVMGNMRLAALQLLGDEAPMVGIIVRHRSMLDQLLDMIDENGMRFDPDPISQGLHYRYLMETHGLSKQSLQTRVGVSAPTINNRLLLLDLPQGVQELIAAGSLPKATDAVTALLTLPEEAMLRTAQRLAKRGADTRMILGTCKAVLLGLNGTTSGGNGSKLRVTIANADEAPAITLATKDASTIPQHVAEAITHTCNVCPMREDASFLVCNECPLTDFARTYILSVPVKSEV